MRVYLLVARGPRASFNSTGEIFCKTLFRSRARAEAEIPAFTRLASTPLGSFADLSHVDTVRVIEFELEDEVPHAQ